MLATPVADELQVARVVTFCVLPSLYVPLATYCCVVLAKIDEPIGVKVNDVKVAAGVMITVAVVLTPAVAVRVTVWAVAPEEAVAVNVADAELAGTVTEPGTGSAAALLDESVTMRPPVGGACVKVIVQVVETPGVTLAGAHASEDTLGILGTTVTDAVALAPRVAVNVTVWDDGTDPAVAVNVVELVFAVTTTVAGTGSAGALLEASVTALPPAGAA